MTAPHSPSPDPSGAVMADAQIFDRGYRTFEGERTGVPGAIKTLVRHSVRSALGLGRPARFKVAPILILVLAYLPAIVYVGVAALIPGEELEGEFIPTYAEFYSNPFVVTSAYLFAGLVVPALLCPDRRTGMLGVYLASPLDRPTYLLGKGIAVFTTLSLVLFAPPFLLLIALTLEGSGPDSFVEWIETFGLLLLGSTLLGVFFSAVGIAIASTTDRSVAAAAATLVVFPGSAAVAAILVEETDQSPLFRILSLPTIPRELIYRLHGERNGSWTVTENSTISLWLMWAGWVALGLAVTWIAYRRLLVRR